MDKLMNVTLTIDKVHTVSQRALDSESGLGGFGGFESVCFKFVTFILLVFRTKLNDL